MTRSLTIPISSGSDPEPIEVDDAHEAVGEMDDFGDVIELCDYSPTGQCEYTIFDPLHCRHCGKGGGV